MMYIKPQPKSGVYFTRNLTSDNYSRGLRLLTYYYDNSVISRAPYYPITNKQGMINYLNSNYPTYIEALGELMDSVDESKLILAMKEAAKRGLTDYPRPTYFSQAIVNNTGYTLAAKVGDALGAVGESIMDLGKLAFFASVVGLGVIAYIEFGPILKEIFKKAKAV